MAQGQNTPSSNGGRLNQRIPALSNTHINSWASNVPALTEGYVLNGIAEQYSNDPNRNYVTHRPHVNVTTPVSGGGGTKGRGIYWWSTKGTKYFMNDNVIYKNNYATPCSLYGGDTAITSGSDKVYFREWSSANEDYLFITDPENDNIYVIASSADTTVINISDRTSGTGAPFHASDSWDFDAINAAIAASSLVDGAVALDTYLFLGTKDGKIYNSGVDDWLNWNALGVVTAERAPDNLFFIGKQQDEVVAIGGASIEIFYDNANEAPASPLSNRTDVAHRLGAAFGQTCWELGDTIYFMGLDEGGDLTPMSLTNRALTKHSNPTLQSFLWMTRYISDLDMIAHGFTVGGHVYYVLTSLEAGVAKTSMVYDASTDIWSEWQTTVNSTTNFQLIGFMRRAAQNDNRPFGMFRNGDLWLPADSKVPYDIVDGGSNVNIPLTVTTGPFDAGTSDDKYMHSLNYVGNQVASAQNMTLEWSDDDGATWLSQTIDLADRTQINRMGKFVSRRFRYTITGTQYVRIEGLDVTFSQGDN